ncbi:MAG TPA: hypothetical protein VF794_12865 [Archangium sp.]|jgi:hypothetical protein|uniref:hypothetical protein n=1 Tax=Archangium sp. TaxID=1872627 RepID=UPI002ED8DA93
MAREISEAEVVDSLKTHLLEQGLQGYRVGNVLVDAHPAYTHSRFIQRLEPTARIPIGGAYPDMLCTLARPDRSAIIGFEVKASGAASNGGVGQASQYRRGVHYAYLAFPGRAANQELKALASRNGVGLLLRDDNRWNEVLRPDDPLPLPWTADSVAAALHGVPAVRRLQLNHPLNYLVVPWLAVSFPQVGVLRAMEQHWPDLRSASSRKHALDGAMALGLLDMGGRLTLEGLTTADLLSSAGFPPTRPIDKRRRLVESAPAVAAVARVVLLRQATVRLIVDTLRTVTKPLSTPELFLAARHLDLLLASTLLLSDPSRGEEKHLKAEHFKGVDFNPSVVFKFKQALWHAGLLSTPIHKSAGRGAADYEAAADIWAFDSDHVGRLATWR